ncbi:hypothetical protein D5S18_13855 [Nocardia panacis]|uniref:Lipoprotein n=1 Tax=Nocardia panacis TaxID=2340916 RepID=A0A3A4K927_9NOCA|nr:hypothetical protein [Nocardia panacis]RJO75852.1 hypothetical protein D5S18_13855 [Nocardia panacis]
MRGLERAGLLAAAAATAAGIMIIGACSKQVPGNAQVNRADLASYAADVTSSSVAASSSKAASIERAAVTACNAFRDAHEATVNVFNDYIDASNTNAPDQNSKADAAVAALRDTAGKVGKQLTKDVPPDVSGALQTYRDDISALADTLAHRADTDTLNGAIDKFNGTKDRTLAACRPHGR